MDEALVEGQTHWVENAGVRLHVWAKRLQQRHPAKTNAPVIILAHGSATAGRESFDLQVSGQLDTSLMDVLARKGFDVFAPDVRGFGRSTHPQGFITTEEACSDLKAVVEYVVSLRQVEQVHLLAWSWGTQYAGQFVMTYPEKVARYISYAQMHSNSPDLIERKARLETFRRSPYLRITEAGWKLRFDSMTPSDVNNADIVNAFAAAAVAVEQKTPTGPQIDLLTRMPLLDARLMNVPVMMVHGQYDDVADPQGLWPFFQLLPHPYKKYVVLPDAGHMMHLQKGRKLFHHEVSGFLSGSV